MTFISQTTRPLSTPDILVPDVICDASVVVGDWVRMNASNIAVKALADNADNSNTIGLVEEKITSTKCVVRVAGVSRSLFSGLDVTKEYFLSSATSGDMTLSPPVGSGEIVLVLGQPFDGTRFLVQKGTRFRRS